MSVTWQFAFKSGGTVTALQFIIRLFPPLIYIPNCVILYLYNAIVKALTQIITGHSS